MRFVTAELRPHTLIKSTPPKLGTVQLQGNTCEKVVSEHHKHIPHLFRFSPEELAFLESSYREREALIDSFTPWDDRNYAIDEQWASFYPYGQTVKAGESTELEVRIWNHSTENHKYIVEAHGIATGTAEIELGPRETGAASVSVAIPTDAPSGIEVITATIKRDDGVECRHWCEALLRIE